MTHRPSHDSPGLHSCGQGIRCFELVSMDIEGGEWPTLTDARLAQLPARVAVMEWHEHRSPHPSPRAYACDLLAAAGLVRQWHEPGRLASNGLLWAQR